MQIILTENEYKLLKDNSDKLKHIQKHIKELPIYEDNSSCWNRGRDAVRALTLDETKDIVDLIVNDLW